jgi:protein MpaA
MNFLPLKSGKTVAQEEIKAYKTETKTKKYLYLLAGVHGDEVEGIYVLEQLFNWLQQEAHELPLVVLPILNLDGHQAQTRTNAHHVDLNRNLPTTSWQLTSAEDPRYYGGPQALSEPENVYLVSLFKKYHPGLIISFHSWKPLLNYNGNCQQVAEFITQYNHYPLEADVGYPTPGSLGEYGPSCWQAPVLTYELPPFTEELSLKDIWAQNEAGLKAFLRSELLQTYLS